MNNRDYKNFTAGRYYHIYNRGNGKMNIYRDNQDYFNFLKRLKLTLGVDNNKQNKSGHTLRIQPLPEGSFSIICYCLMPNHFHFLIKQNKNVSISLLFNKICSSYTKYFNKKYDSVGHLLQDRLKAAIVDNDKYLLWLSAYIHQNPRVAGISDFHNYRWSSYSDYINPNNESFCNKEIIVSRFKNIDEYEDFVKDSYTPIKEGKIIDKIDIILD